jgi:hypothetical protein
VAQRVGPGRRGDAEADGRELGADEQLELGCGLDELGQERGLLEVALDRAADRVGAVDGERQPQLQGPQGREYSSVRSTGCICSSSCGM